MSIGEIVADWPTGRCEPAISYNPYRAATFVTPRQGRSSKPLRLCAVYCGPRRHCPGVYD
jgi:hypothetical protein